MHHVLAFDDSRLLFVVPGATISSLVFVSRKLSRNNFMLSIRSNRTPLLSNRRHCRLISYFILLDMKLLLNYRVFLSRESRDTLVFWALIKSSITSD